MHRGVQEQEEEPEYDEGDLGEGPSAKRRKGPEEAGAEGQGAEDADMGEGEEGEGEEGEPAEPVFTPGERRGRGDGVGRGSVVMGGGLFTARASAACTLLGDLSRSRS